MKAGDDPIRIKECWPHRCPPTLSPAPVCLRVYSYRRTEQALRLPISLAVYSMRAYFAGVALQVPRMPLPMIPSRKGLVWLSSLTRLARSRRRREAACYNAPDGGSSTGERQEHG